jgi:hypothetical protein
MIDIAITGSHARPFLANVEASWNGGAWSTLTTAPLAISFSGTLADQVAGQGALSVRWYDYPAYVYSTQYIGIGDIFIIAGQSNAGEIADNNQAYSHATLKASVNYAGTWRELTAGGGAGSMAKSCWPLVATAYLANQSVPIGFLACGEGSTSITQWQKPGSLYNRITAAKTLLGNAKCLLWQQGETDAGNGMSQVDYQTYLGALVDTVFADTGLKMMISKLQTCSAYTAGQRDTINAGIDYVWDNNANALAGPDFSDYTLTSAVHFQTDAEQAVQGSRWWAAIKAAYSW